MLWQLTGSSPVQLRLRGESPVSPEHLQQLETWVRRRSQREPLQHILGTAPFLEWEIEVSGDVLVPRPETEVLALSAQDWLRQRAPGVAGNPLKALDIGTGSGCLAIALAGIPGWRFKRWMRRKRPCASPDPMRPVSDSTELSFCTVT